MTAGPSARAPAAFARRLAPGFRSLYLAPFRVDLDVREGVPAVLPGSALARALVAALRVAGAPEPASAGLVLGDDALLAGLNAAHMGKTGPTDVLSFPLLPPGAFPPHEGGSPRPSSARPPQGSGAVAPAAAGADPRAFLLPPGMRLHLGDVVVSVERAIAQADAGRGGQTGDVRWSPAYELRLLVVHGGLHLCGWDHAEPAEEAAMRSLEQRILATAV